MSVLPGSPQTESHTHTDAQPRPMVRIVGLLWVVVIAIIVAFAYFASSLCITFLLAGFLALVFDPIPTYLEKLRIPRVLSTGVLIIAGGLGIAVLVHATYGKANQVVEDFPDYAERIHDAFEPLSQGIEKVQKTAGSITAGPAVPVSKKAPPTVRVAQQSQPAAWPSYLIRGVGSVWGAVIVGGIVPFLMFFMLVRKSHLYGWMENTFGETVDVAQFAARLTKMVRGFVLGNLIIGAAMAAVMVGILYVLQIQGAVPLGIASGFLNLIPFLGAILAAALPLFASILQFDSPAPFIIIAAAIALHLVSANLLVPRLIGSRVNIGPVAATMGMLFWGWLWGIMGVLLAVPLTAFVKLVADCHPSLIHISNLLAEKPRTVPNWAQVSSERVVRAVPFFTKHLRTDGKD